MKFRPENVPELVPATQYFRDCEKNGTKPLLPSLRSFYFRVYEARDRSFVEESCAVKIANSWYIWPRACEQLILDQVEKSRRTPRAA